jgi:isoquinoline 1-oxidoreductase beta subunit
MTESLTTSRRSFLKTTAAASGGLLMGMMLPVSHGVAQAAGVVHAPNAWVHIGEDDSISILTARSEMGQGVYTALPMLVAEELNVELSQIKVVDAPPAAVYNNALLGAQLTGGSTSVREGWETLRIAGAQVREMLISAAAARWNLDRSQLKADKGMVLGPNGRKASYGSLAADAAKLPVPERPPIKHPKDFRLVGKPTRRIDTPAKSNGTAEFGIDVKLPGMVYATVLQCPVIGGKVQSFDAAVARQMPGVQAVVQISDGVAVVADSWWRAKKAMDTVKVQWDEGKGASLSDAAIIESARQAFTGGKLIEIAKPQGDAEAAMQGAKWVIEAEYVSPLQSHSPLEPMNFTADVQGSKVLLIGPTQFQQGAQGAVAAALGVKPEDITLRTTYLGGGFGRRLELDFVVQAVEISKAVGKPVKLLWTREEDMTHDFYRPVGVNRLKAGLDDKGMPVAFQFRLVSQGVTQRAFGMSPDVLDPFMAEAAVTGYSIPNSRHDLVNHDSGFRVGYWRAVSHNMNAFANESFIDELARAAGQDPYQYRLKLVADKPRFANVLKLAAQAAGWGKALPKGRARGIALMEGYDTYMAQVAEISQNADGSIRVHRVSVAADLGYMVNPDTVRAQLQSGIIFGMGATLKHQITLKNGRVQETNFHAYEPVRMQEVPQIDIQLVASTEKPGGIGEPATAVIAPAIANAVAALTGKRVRRLPITADAIRQA